MSDDAEKSLNREGFSYARRKRLTDEEQRLLLEDTRDNALEWWFTQVKLNKAKGVDAAFSAFKNASITIDALKSGKSLADGVFKIIWDDD
jgi:hypothetical protein